MNLEIKTLVPSSVFGDFTGVRGISLGPMIAEGGFGKVFPAERVHGKRTSKLVVKILNDGVEGDRCYETAKRVQAKLKDLDQSQYSRRGESLRTKSALYGSPQFCFEGDLEGQPVKGYAMLNLTHLGYVLFDSITEAKDDDLRSQYHHLEIGAKLKIAYSLVFGLRVLSELYYVHADINPPNLFVNLKTLEAAIIDFDGGAIMDGPNEAPGTLGRIMDAEWLAPEILAQLALGIQRNMAIRINLLTDFWSVSVAVHYLLFLRGPYFFLRQLGRPTVLDYLGRYRWYDAGPNHPSVDASKMQQHSGYVEYVSQLPRALMDRFRRAFNEGFANPLLRPTSAQWVNTLEEILASKPTIATFYSTQTNPIEGQKFLLRWTIQEEYETLLDGQDVTGEYEKEMQLDEPRDIILEARGIGGAAAIRQVRIEVQRYPRIIEFDSDAIDVGEGKAVRLRWDARFHQQLWLNGEELPSSTTAKVVYPIGPTTEYILSSQNAIGKAVSQVVTVRVHKPPILKGFWTDRRAMTSQDILTLLWTAERADEIEFRFRQLVKHQYVEQSQVVPAAKGRFETHLGSTTEITCIARSKYGESGLGPLRVEVVPVPKLEFMMQEVASLPTMVVEMEVIDLTSCGITFSQTPIDERILAIAPAEVGEMLDRKTRNLGYLFLFSLCLALVSGVIGYFLALHR